MTAILMHFKAIKVKKGSFKILGLEAYLESKIRDLKAALGLTKAPRAGTKSKAAAKKAKAPARTAKRTELEVLLHALSSHRQRKALIKAGKQKDQLLRSLIPLYLGRTVDLPVSSGLASQFWAAQGVTFAAPNAAKALRQKPGHSRRTRQGPVITSTGIAYVEQALR